MLFLTVHPLPEAVVPDGSVTGWIWLMIVLALIVAAGQWYQSRKIKEVHVIVNSQKTAMQEEIRALRAQLKLAEAAPAEEA